MTLVELPDLEPSWPKAPARGAHGRSEITLLLCWNYSSHRLIWLEVELGLNKRWTDLSSNSCRHSYRPDLMFRPPEMVTKRVLILRAMSHTAVEYYLLHERLVLSLLRAITYRN